MEHLQYEACKWMDKDIDDGRIDWEKAIVSVKSFAIFLILQLSLGPSPAQWVGLWLLLAPLSQPHLDRAKKIQTNPPSKWHV